MGKNEEGILDEIRKDDRWGECRCGAKKKRARRRVREDSEKGGRRGDIFGRGERGGLGGLKT